MSIFRNCGCTRIFRRVIQDSYLKQGELIRISPWRQCQTICRYVNGLSEELLLPEEMRRTCGNQLGGRIEVLARMMMKYTRLEEERHFIDFSRLQKETYALLSSYPEILDQLQKRIRYIMIDEYQDTNFHPGAAHPSSWGLFSADLCGGG